ncbi:nucleotidyltransferase-like protein [Paenibacillus hodogayensis]|uniref:Nucleotidyltransferase-like protein n=1 Tax=Paenibacillus hodogayensis TaxID=279208 RepID=A0ABV5VZI4_9BACL
MEAIHKYMLDKYRHNPETISVSIMQNPAPFSPVVDGLDVVVLVVLQTNHNDSTTHYIKDDIRIQERCLQPGQLEQWILSGGNRNVIHWILQGEIVMDRNMYLEGLQHRLLELPEELRGKKMIVEFDRFMKSFLQSKQYLAEGHLLDAYSNILDALCHWAHIAILEEGIHPETLVWAQVKKINPGVYKFYEELTSNHESLEKRIQLVLLACEFSVMSKMESCCSVLIDLLRSREQPWSLKELMEVEQMGELRLDLSLLLNKLVRKSLIREVVEAADCPDTLLLQMKYTV